MAAPNRKANQRQRRQEIRQQHQEARKARIQKQRQQFTEPLTPRHARRIAKTEAAAEYRPVERQIASEIAGSAKREGDISNWYNKLAADYMSQGASATDALKAAQDVTSQRLAEAAQREQGTIQSLASEDKKTAELLNAPTNSQGLSQAAEAAAAADRARVNLNQPVDLQRANEVAFIGSKVAGANLGGIQAHKEESQRRKKIQQDLRSAKKERGAATVKNLQNLREGDRQYKLELMAFTKEKPYEQAVREQARLGYKGKARSAAAQENAAKTYTEGTRASAAAQENAAKIYGRSKENSAKTQKEIARLYREGKDRTAEALENQAKIYGQNSSNGGYNVREAQGLLSSAGKHFKNKQAAINYLINRGVKLNVARKAVNRATH